MITNNCDSNCKMCQQTTPMAGDHMICLYSNKYNSWDLLRPNIQLSVKVRPRTGVTVAMKDIPTAAALTGNKDVSSAAAATATIRMCHQQQQEYLAQLLSTLWSDNIIPLNSVNKQDHLTDSIS